MISDTFFPATNVISAIVQFHGSGGRRLEDLNYPLFLPLFLLSPLLLPSFHKHEPNFQRLTATHLPKLTALCTVALLPHVSKRTRERSTN